ncbi:MAG: thiamine biosynthesis protein ThiF [Gammaproteobacteria bacterium]|nr:MAG: thiamine biosynthesis protein ThiF [Gammaproteobacteria bacterium]
MNKAFKNSCNQARYSRQIQVAQVGSAGQNKLQNAHVGLVGVGGLGCPVALYLAGAGVGKITLIDHDVVSESNLHRQILFTQADIGESKADIAQRRLSAHNPDVEIVSHREPLRPDNLDDLADADVIVDACDNFVVSYLLSDYARERQKPLVSASVMQTHGYVGVYGFRSDTQKPCPSLRAVFPNPPQVGQDCNSVGVIGTSAGIIGTLQAQEVLKVILGDNAQLAGQLLSLDLWTHRQSLIDFSGAPEPTVKADIITEPQLQSDDWIIDVRSELERHAQPKQCHQAMPLSEIKISELPQNKRLVFTCASGQRALVVADKAITAGFSSVAVLI